VWIACCSWTATLSKNTKTVIPMSDVNSFYLAIPKRLTPTWSDLNCFDFFNWFGLTDSTVTSTGNNIIWSNVERSHLHRESKKQDTKLLSMSLPNIDRFSKFFQWYTHTQQEIYNKAFITDPITTKRYRHTTLRNIAHWRECDRCRRAAGTKPTRPPTNSSFHTPNGTIWCRTDRVFHRNHGLKC